MGPLTEAEMAQRLSSAAQVRKYAHAVDRESAAKKPAAGAREAGPSEPAPVPRRGKEPPSTLEQVLKSPVTRTVAGVIARGLMGALLGRRRRS